MVLVVKADDVSCSLGSMGAVQPDGKAGERLKNVTITITETISSECGGNQSPVTNTGLEDE